MVGSNQGCVGILALALTVKKSGLQTSRTPGTRARDLAQNSYPSSALPVLNPVRMLLSPVMESPVSPLPGAGPRHPPSPCTAPPRAAPLVSGWTGAPLIVRSPRAGLEGEGYGLVLRGGRRVSAFFGCFLQIRFFWPPCFTASQVLAHV